MSYTQLKYSSKVTIFIYIHLQSPSVGGSTRDSKILRQARLWKIRLHRQLILASSVADSDHFETVPDPDPGSKKSAKIMEKVHKNQRKS